MGRNQLTGKEFEIKLTSRYPGILTEYTKLLQNPKYHLATIAKKYGFSREYARQIFERLYGMPYTPIRKLKKQGW